MKIIGFLFIGLAMLLSHAFGKNEFQVDTLSTSSGKLLITFIGHSTLMFEYQGNVIHIDPVTREADYTQLPKGDLILIMDKQIRTDWSNYSRIIWKSRYVFET